MNLEEGIALASIVLAALYCVAFLDRPNLKSGARAVAALSGVAAALRDV